MDKGEKRIADILKRDSEVFLNTTRSAFNFVADHGDGDFAYDINGKKLIDFSAFIAVYNLGVNGNKSIHDAVKKQADKLTHSAFTDYYSEPPVIFAESLMKMFPKGFGRMFLSNSGTEANEAAIKFSKIFTGRQYVLSFYNAFHGRTAGSLGLTASKSIQRAHFGPFNSVVHAPYPYPYRCLFNHGDHDCGEDYLDYIREYIFKKEIDPQEVAAIFFEPIQGEGGYIVPPKSFIKGLRELATENGIVLVADEIQSGYMRTGKFLALENFGVDADIYTMAKALGGGLPIGATIARRSLGNLPRGAHANTFGGNHLSIVAARASLDYVKSHKSELERGVKKKSEMIFKRLREMQDDHEIIGDVRGIGLMIGIELVKNRKTKERAVEEREEIVKTAFKKGLLLLTCSESTIRIAPPLTISEDSIEKGLAILNESIKAIKQ